MNILTVLFFFFSLGRRFLKLYLLGLIILSFKILLFYLFLHSVFLMDEANFIAQMKNCQHTE